MAHFTDRPCAAQGLTSYRYKGPFGFIMIGAIDSNDAMRQAQRSLSSGAPSPCALQVWDDNRGTYVNAIG